MERYDYRDAICEDIRLWIEHEADEFKADHADEKGRWLREDNKDEIFEEMNDLLWVNDSITGNASGSYWCNSWNAESAIAHNWDLLADAINEFGGNVDILKEGPESCDVTIRCYLLGECIGIVLDEYLQEEE